jgi:hypothetical protein
VTEPPAELDPGGHPVGEAGKAGHPRGIPGLTGAVKPIPGAAQEMAIAARAPPPSRRS